MTGRIRPGLRTGSRGAGRTGAPGAQDGIAASSPHQQRIDHATWIMCRKRSGLCICLTCWRNA